MSENPVYMIGQIKVTDEKTYFEQYAAKVQPMLAEAGANVLVAAPSPRLLEGEWDANWTVVIQFPSEQKMLGFYESEEYQSVGRPLRLKSTSLNNLIMAPQFVMPAQ